MRLPQHVQQKKKKKRQKKKGIKTEKFSAGPYIPLSPAKYFTISPIVLLASPNTISVFCA